MAVDFSAFDKKVNLAQLQKDVENASESAFEDVPAGDYVASIDKLEIKPTKDGKKLMFAAVLKVKEGTYKNRLLFFHRVIYGNTSPKWTDGMAIKSVCTWLGHLETETVPEFLGYEDFADLVLDIFQEVQGCVEVEIGWDADAFSPITIKEVYDC